MSNDKFNHVNNLSSGSSNIYGATLAAANLTAGSALKTNGLKQLYSTNLEIDDVNGLTDALAVIPGGITDTDDLKEGSTNLYYTDSRVDAHTAVTEHAAHVDIITGEDPHNTLQGLSINDAGSKVLLTPSLITNDLWLKAGETDNVALIKLIDSSGNLFIESGNNLNLKAVGPVVPSDAAHGLYPADLPAETGNLAVNISGDISLNSNGIESTTTLLINPNQSKSFKIATQDTNRQYVTIDTSYTAQNIIDDPARDNPTFNPPTGEELISLKYADVKIEQNLLIKKDLTVDGNITAAAGNTLQMQNFFNNSTNAFITVPQDGNILLNSLGAKISTCAKQVKNEFAINEVEAFRMESLAGDPYININSTAGSELTQFYEDAQFDKDLVVTGVVTGDTIKPNATNDLHIQNDDNTCYTDYNDDKSISTVCQTNDITIGENESLAYIVRNGTKRFFSSTTTTGSLSAVVGDVGIDVNLIGNILINGKLYDADDLTIFDNNATAYQIRQDTNNYLKCDTTNGAEKITIGHVGVTTDVLGTLHNNGVPIVGGGIITDVTLADNDSTAYQIRENTNNYLKCDTTNGSEKITISHAGATTDILGTLHNNGVPVGTGDLTIADNDALAYRLKDSALDYLVCRTVSGDERITIGNGDAITNIIGTLHNNYVPITTNPTDITLDQFSSSAFRIREDSNDYFSCSTTFNAEKVRIHEDLYLYKSLQSAGSLLTVETELQANLISSLVLNNNSASSTPCNIELSDSGQIILNSDSKNSIEVNDTETVVTGAQLRFAATGVSENMVVFTPMTSDSSQGQVVSESSSFGTSEAFLLFDANTLTNNTFAYGTYHEEVGTYQGSETETHINLGDIGDGVDVFKGEWLTMDFGSAQEPFVRVSMEGLFGLAYWPAARGPNEFLISGSADGITWYAIKYFANALWASHIKSFDLTSPLTLGSYRYFRYTLRRNGDPNHTGTAGESHSFAQLTTMDIYSNDACSGFVVTSCSNDLGGYSFQDAPGTKMHLEGSGLGFTVGDSLVMKIDTSTLLFNNTFIDTRISSYLYGAYDDGDFTTGVLATSAGAGATEILTIPFANFSSKNIDVSIPFSLIGFSFRFIGYSPNITLDYFRATYHLTYEPDVSNVNYDPDALYTLYLTSLTATGGAPFSIKFNSARQFTAKPSYNVGTSVFSSVQPVRQITMEAIIPPGDVLHEEPCSFRYFASVALQTLVVKEYNMTFERIKINL